MPDSGYPIADLTGSGDGATSHAEITRTYAILLESVRLAQSHGLFVEWLEAFVGAWEATKDARLAARAGLIEWDM